MTPSPSERRELLALAAAQLVTELRASVDLDEINTLDIATAAQLLGISSKQALRILPVVEVGPRTHRVTVRDLKAAIATRTRQPA
jgi:hypothetical protein